MEIVFLILLVIGLSMLVNVVAPPPGLGGTKNGIPPCPPHKWVDDTSGGLRCDKCKLKPGQIGSSYDKPY